MLKEKKGEVVALLGFTGIRLSDMVISKSTKTEIEIIKADGKVMVFDRKTGVQTNCEEGKEKYANKIVTLADAPERKKKAAPKKAKKVEEEVEEAPKKAKKGKKAPKVVEEPEEEDFEDEDDDEDFEEV